MNTPSRKLSQFSRFHGMTLGMFGLFALAFVLYAWSEKQIDRANGLWHNSYVLAEELQRSSDELTRMVQTYVVTGDPVYKHFYQEILDIRDGKRPRPSDHTSSPGVAVPLLELMRRAGFTKEEFAKLAEAKTNSDALTGIEFVAIALIESPTFPSDAHRVTAIRMLHDIAYFEAKDSIMRPISEFRRMADERTREAVRAAKVHATWIRAAYILFGLVLAFLLWRARRKLHTTLGASANELYTHIARLGSGNFSSVIAVPAGAEHSVLAWLSETQTNLAHIDGQRRQAEAEVRERTKELAQSELATLNMMEDAVSQRENTARANEQLEQRVIERTADLEQARDDANKANQAKSSFLAAMSHEIRTPMNGVIGMVDVLHQSSLRGDQVEMVDLIRESAFSLLTIIDDILDFSKIEAGRMEIEHAPLSVGDVVEKACGMLDQLAVKKGVELTMFCDPSIPDEVLGDGPRLRQVLVNIVGNAIKFSSGREQSGRVSVRVLPSAPTAQDTVGVEIRVTDNGIGMDQETQARIFAPFTQADSSTTRRFGGTGLGLIISRRLVELMGGELSLQSTPEQGATFIVSLQFALPQTTAPVVNAASEVAGLCCLVVGGPDGLAGNMAAYLTHDGARVERATDLAQVHGVMLGLPPGPWVWIIDAAYTSTAINELRALARALPEHEIRFLAVERGSRRALHAKYADMGLVDGNVLTRRRLSKAVAIVAGRETKEEHVPLSGKHAVTFKPPLHDDVSRSGRLILVAEDNETNQKVILRQLALLGFAADVAGDGRLALERWQSGHYALLLSDLHMPEMDGYQLTAAIRAQEQGSRRIPILALTANALKGEADHCRAVGMDDYLTKPVQLADLKAALETWLPAPASSLNAPVAPGTAAASAVDVSVLEKLIGKDPALVLEFLNDFRISAAKIALELKTACADRQSAQASAQAHKLKSSARTVGALTLGDLCAKLEDAGTAGDTEMLATLFPAFEHELGAVDTYLDSLRAQGAERRHDK